ncbi:phosphatase PAP2 family protein [Microbacterium binotii]|uniref:phosphatase PAP2 family protein n=1 Tax=Microbacterium binotii TaxID=462710 RepID=UPI001F32E32F|nr:phosphatase PAP2 family protein [Microbacterium binotii]UIN30180.1 phosphatase PAP2 family protein [Microbacterium binotii]
MGEVSNRLGVVTGLRWWILLAIAVAVMSAVYVLAVLTPTGQALENAAIAGTHQVSAATGEQALQSLDAITLTTLAAATVVIIAIGVLRRQYELAALAAAVIVGGQVVTQGLKRYILPRPELIGADATIVENSFPSGHTTIAMTLLIAVFLVVPFRWRGVAMTVVMTWAIAIGAYTITARWHRFSDTLGADMVALGLGAVVSLILLRTGRIVPAASRPRARVLFVILMSLVAAVMLVLGVFIAVAASRYPLDDPIIQWDLYLAANSLAIAGSAWTGLVFWLSWRRLEIRPQPRKSESREV